MQIAEAASIAQTDPLIAEGTAIVISAILSALVVIAATLVGIRNSKKADALRQAGMMDMLARVNTLIVDSARQAKALDYNLKQLAEHDGVRKDTLNRLSRAAALAHEAANGLIHESHHSPAPELISNMVHFLQDISMFLKETKSIRLNVYLEKHDIDLAINIQDALVKLFLSLDLDGGSEPRYQAKLESCSSELSETVRAFSDWIRAQFKHATAAP